MSKRKKTGDITLFSTEVLSDNKELQDTSSFSASPGVNRKKKGPGRSSILAINAGSGLEPYNPPSLDPYEPPIVESSTRHSQLLASEDEDSAHYVCCAVKSLAKKKIRMKRCAVVTKTVKGSGRRSRVLCQLSTCWN